jgi:hypothetical protein
VLAALLIVLRRHIGADRTRVCDALFQSLQLDPYFDLNGLGSIETFVG